MRARAFSEVMSPPYYYPRARVYRNAKNFTPHKVLLKMNWTDERVNVHNSKCWKKKAVLLRQSRNDNVVSQSFRFCRQPL